MADTIARRARNPLWVARKLLLWGGSYLRLSPQDVVFAFFPKTGSTWVRIFFFHLLHIKSGAARGKFTFDELDASMPEFAHRSFFKGWPFPDYPRLIKTHRPYNPLFRNNDRVVLFIREPRDVMVSYLHYANANKELGFHGELDDLVRHPELGLRYYLRFIDSWRGRAGLVVKYEDLRQDPLPTFAQLAEFIGIDCNAGEIEQALEQSSLERTRRAQRESSAGFQSKFSDGFVFARSGRLGEGAAQFGPELDAYYRALRDEFQFDFYAG